MGVLNRELDPLRDFDNMPLSHARIGYENLLTGADNASLRKALSANTYERATYSAPTTNSDWQFSGDQTVDYIGIAAHNLSGKSFSLKYATTVGGPYTEFFSLKPANNDAIMILLDEPITMEELRITFDSPDGDEEIGVLHAGVALQMYQPIYGGHSPINLSAQTDYQSIDSEDGQFLGRTIIREGTQSSFTWRHLDPDWYREKFLPFVRAARTSPFFIKWRPDLYEDTVYGRIDEDIRPQNMGGGHKLMTVTVTIKGHADI